MRWIGSKGCGAGQFQQPLDVCVSLCGEWLFVADRDNHRVQVLRASDGEHVHTIGSTGNGDGQFNSPVAVCLSPNVDLFVLENGNHRVQVFTA